MDTRGKKHDSHAAGAIQEQVTCSGKRWKQKGSKQVERCLPEVGAENWRAPLEAKDIREGFWKWRDIEETRRKVAMMIIEEK